MPLRIIAILAAIIAALLYFAISAHNRGEALTYADAEVVKAEHMCVPYYEYGSGKNRHTRRPKGWSQFGRSCALKDELQNVYRRGYDKLYDYWQADVVYRLEDGREVRGHISTYRMPLVFFKSGSTSRDPDATKGLPLFREKPLGLVQTGDRMPVSFVTSTGTELKYAPNEWEYTQYSWILIGVATMIGILWFAFAL